jgi:hypothetical protein
MKTRRRWKNPPAGSTGVVRKMGRVYLTAINHMMPGGVAAAGGHHKQFFEFGKRHGILFRFKGKHTVWNLCPQKKTP